MEYTKEECHKEALKYKTKTEFHYGNKRIKTYARDKGWLYEITSHMGKKKSLYTKEECHEEALKYSNKTDFHLKSRSIKDLSVKKGWYYDITGHMFQTQTQKPSGYWTDERCKLECLKYNTRSELRDKSPRVYSILLVNGRLDAYCAHMIEKIKPSGYWTIEKSIKAVNECVEKNMNKSRVRKKYPRAYEICSKNNLIDELFVNVEPIGNKCRRVVYSISFQDKSIYIGLTYNHKKRLEEHKTSTRSSVFMYIKKTNLEPKMVLLSSYVSVVEAQEIENREIENYKKLGFNVLNRCKGGSIGSVTIIWTKEVCQVESLKYSNRSEFRKNNLRCYRACYKKGWLGELCSHMDNK